MKTKILLATTLVMFCLAAGAARAQTPLTEPYLQNMTTTGVTIMWETSKSQTCTVSYGLTSGYGNTAGYTTQATGGNTVVYKSVLTGLAAGTVYHYRVTAGSWSSADNTFVTAPAGNVDFTFGVWSDSQGGNYSPTADMMAHMAGQVDIAASCGDTAEDGSNYDSITQYFLDRVHPFMGLASVPFWVAWGNHCNYGTEVNKFSGQSPSDGNVSFMYSGCSFIVIDDSNYTDYAWIETQLQNAQAQGARHKFVFIHRPPYCERWIDGEPAVRDNIVPLLEQYDVDVCFSGHTHEYERGYLNGVYYCMTGGGSWLDTAEPLVRDWPHMTVGGYHDLAPGINGGLINEYVRVNVTSTGWTATMLAFNTDGTPRPDVTDVFRPTAFSVVPGGTQSSQGPQGGPFTPSAHTYTLANSGTAALNWTAAKTQTWLTLSSTGGTLQPGAQTTVNATINSNANSLPEGGYTDTVTFTDTTNNVTEPREVKLDVGVFAGRWPFNEGTGTIAYDASGHGAHGTITNGTWVTGVEGGAIAFNGTSTKVTFGTGPSLSGTTDFTVSAWVKTSAAAAQNIIQQRNGGYVGEYKLSLTATGTVSFMLYGSGGYQFDFSTAGAVNNGGWHFITAKRSGTAGVIYIDGAPAANASGAIQALDGAISVGVGADIRDSLAFFNGSIDDPRVYKVALTDQQVLDLFNSYGYTPPVPQTYNPSSYQVINGTYGSGSVSNLVSDDNAYLVINSQTSGTTRYATTDFTVTGITQVPATIAVKVVAKSTVSSTTQKILLWNYGTSAWDQKDSASIGTAEVIRTFTVSSGATSYVSGGQLKVRTDASKSKKTFSHSLDELDVTITP